MEAERWPRRRLRCWHQLGQSRDSTNRAHGSFRIESGDFPSARLSPVGRGTQAERILPLDAPQENTIFFEGTAREAALAIRMTPISRRPLRLPWHGAISALRVHHAVASRRRSDSS